MDLPASDSQEAQSQPDAQPVQAEHRQPEWWERFLAIPPVMAIIGAVGVYLTPLHPEIIQFVVGWSFLLLCLFSYLLLRMLRELARPHYQWVEWPANGPPVVHRQRQYFLPLMFLALAAAILTFLSVLVMLKPDPLDPGSKISLFAIDFALTLIVALLWLLGAGATGGTLDKVLGEYRPAVVCLLLAVGLYFFFDWSSLTAATDGPAASWQAQLQFAQQEADRVAGGSTLMDVAAQEQQDALFGSHNLQHPLDVAFYFRGPSGEDISVHILDGDPPRLVSVFSGSRETALAKTEKQRLAAAFSTVKLSPRQIFEQIETELNQSDNRLPVTFGTFTVSAVSNDAGNELYGAPLIWVVDLDEEYFQGINPSTGKVLWTGSPRGDATGTSAK